MSTSFIASRSPFELANSSRNTDVFDHQVQFYENEHFLYERVAAFVTPALECDEGVIIIATHSHLAAFEQCITVLGYDIAYAKSRGQVVMLDATDTLTKFMYKGVPDAGRFNQVVGGIVKRMNEEFPRIRAYGEMVNLLWAEGNFYGTIELEELWNDLGKIYSFSLLCGYGINNFDQQAHGKALYQICNSHSHVLPAESLQHSHEPHAQGRTIALLQQQVKALQTEVAKYKHKELSMQQDFCLHGQALLNAGEALKIPLASLKLQLESLSRAIDKEYESAGCKQVKTALENSRCRGNELSKLLDQLLHLIGQQ